MSEHDQQLMDIACRMAGWMEDYARTMRDEGTPVDYVDVLVAEFNDLHAEMQPWQDLVTDSETAAIAALCDDDRAAGGAREADFYHNDVPHYFRKQGA